MLLGTMLALVMSTAPAAGAPVAFEGSPEATAQRAYELFATPSEWKQAGKLLLQAASERGGTDPHAVEWTMNAARALYAAGDVRGARAAFELAADRGVAIGSVAQAANAYLFAAAIAAERRDTDGARRLSQKAELLSQSPHLDQRVRESILNRLPG